MKAKLKKRGEDLFVIFPDQLKQAYGLHPGQKAEILLEEDGFYFQLKSSLEELVDSVPESQSIDLSAEMVELMKEDDVDL